MLRAEHSIRAAYVVACATLLCGAFGFRSAVVGLNAYLHKEPAPLREPLTTIPATLGPWRAMSADEVLSDAVVEELGTKSYLSRLYAIDGDMEKGWLQLHIAFYTGLVDTVPHIPERCFTAGGLIQIAAPARVALPVDRSSWREGAGPVNRASGQNYPLAFVTDPVTRRREEVVLPVGDTALTAIEFQKGEDPNLRIIGGYFFVANGRLTPSAYAVRELSFSLSERYAYFCKVQFTAQFRGNPEAMETFRTRVADLVGYLLPHLMRRLPSWPEYEARSTDAAPPT